MAKDYRLDLDRNINYGQDIFAKKKNLNFDDLFSAKASTGAAPWMPSRFEGNDIVRRIQTQKLKFNPGLNFVGDNPEEYEVFAGLGRFKRKEDYDFNVGRPNTHNQPQNQPGFNQFWVDAYNLSPTLNPEKRITNPMPRASNPDPRGFLMATAEKKAENEAKDNKSVAQLLQESNNKSTDKKDTSKKETSVSSLETFKQNNEPPKA